MAHQHFCIPANWIEEREKGKKHLSLEENKLEAGHLLFCSYFICQNLNWLPIAAVTHYRKCSGLKQEKCMLSQFFLGFTELQSRFPHGHSPSGSSRGEFPCVFQLLVMVVFLDCDCIAHISACVVILPSPLPYVVSFWLCFIRTLVIAFGNHLDNPGRYHHLKTLNSVTSANSLLPHKGTFTRSRD